MAFLNGKFVEDSEIDPGKHKFIGTFRPPNPEMCLQNPELPKHCSCMYGSCWGMNDITRCWSRGHFDQPQYETIK